jgi:hypothetical protein
MHGAWVFLMVNRLKPPKKNTRDKSDRLVLRSPISVFGGEVLMRQFTP